MFGAPGPPDRQRRSVGLTLLFWLTPVILGLVAFAVTSTIYHTAPPVLDQSPGQSRIPRDAMLNFRLEGLSVCVKAVAGASIDTAQAKQVVENVLLILSQGDRWLRTEYAKAPPIIDVGC